MSANRGYVMECWTCRAQTVIRTDWNGRLVEDKGVCTCSAVVVERAPKGPELELKTCACGKPCRFKMCLDCSNAKQKASDRNRKGARICVDCNRSFEGMGKRCPECSTKFAQAAGKLGLAVRMQSDHSKAMVARDAEIQALLAAGTSAKVVALEFGLSTARVCQIGRAA